MRRFVPKQIENISIIKPKEWNNFDDDIPDCMPLPDNFLLLLSDSANNTDESLPGIHTSNLIENNNLQSVIGIDIYPSLPIIENNNLQSVIGIDIYPSFSIIQSNNLQSMIGIDKCRFVPFLKYTYHLPKIGMG